LTVTIGEAFFQLSAIRPARRSIAAVWCVVSVERSKSSRPRVAEGALLTSDEIGGATPAGPTDLAFAVAEPGETLLE